MADSKQPTDTDLSAIKSRLKAGQLSPTDLDALKSLVERTEAAAKNLRAAIVE